jgi:hypothetical protein
MELTYVEALQAYWSIYWPSQLFSIFTNPVFVLGLWFRISSSTYFFTMSSLSPFLQFALQFTLGALGLFLYVHRAFGSFHGFSIFIIEEPNGSAVSKLNLKRRAHVWFYLFSRQIVAGIAAAILALPLNVLLSLIGLRSIFGLDIGFWISTLGVILAVGPILLKMLISCPFEGFHIEVQRT